MIDFPLWLAVFILLIAYWIKVRLDKLSVLKRHNIPGPRPSFLDGNLSQVRVNNITTISNWVKEYGDICGYYMGTQATVIVKDIELLKLIQIKDFNNFVARRLPCYRPDPHQRQDGRLTNQANPRWKEVRSILTPTFNASKMKQTVPLINDAVDALLENVSKKCEQDAEFNIYQFYQGLTMDTIGRSAFGIKTNVQRDPNDKFLAAAKASFDDKSMYGSVLLPLNIMFQELTFLIYPLRWLKNQFDEAFDLSAKGILYKVSAQIAAARRKNIADPSNPWSRHDLLQQMLEAKMTGEQLASASNEKLAASTLDVNAKDTLEHADDSANNNSKLGAKTTSKKVHYMTDNEVAGNSVLMFEAGYETTSTALAFVTYLLVKHPDVQDRVREELNQLLEREGKFDYNTVTELQYMEAVLFESMRLFPPITQFVTRIATDDYKYKDITIPRGCGVSVPIYDLHHDPNLWDEPEQFNPDRFFGPNKGKVNPVAYQPFGNGPRNCIGMRFAMLEAKLALARLLKDFKLVPGPSTEIKDIEIDFKPISMTPKNGVFVKAEKI